LFGNRGFKLFDDPAIEVEQMDGLSLDESASDHDKTNLRTLVNLLKKTKTLRVNRLDMVHMVLHILLKNFKHFPNITGLEVEFSDNYSELISKIGVMRD